MKTELVQWVNKLTLVMIANNDSGQKGGGFYLKKGRLDVEGSSVLGNTATIGIPGGAYSPGAVISGTLAAGSQKIEEDS